MNRRELIQLSLASAAALMSPGALAQSKPQKILMLGGTGFIGPHCVRLLRSAGHTLTLFNRGKRNPELFGDIETLIGDRKGQLDALRNRSWDVVIDNSGYFPGHVRLTADLLKDRVQHYIYVSSISVYPDLSQPGLDEDAPVAKLEDPDAAEITNENYGALKAACEQVVEQTYGERHTVIRPSYIVGPGDTSDRFTYWPVRAARGGEMLAPGAPGDPIQFIDVRDLADFMRLCAEQRVPGRYNLCNPPGAVTMGDLLETSKRIANADTRFVWASADFLEQRKLIESGEIPIWAPPSGAYAGGALVSSARAVAKGLRFRPLDTTVRDTLAWHETRPAEQKEKLRAGLTVEREKQLLNELKRSA
jgi:2'-hydroxyisoflavone reductase